MANEVQYYFVGATYGKDDQTPRFVDQGIWELGGDDSQKEYQKMAAIYNNIKPGDKLIIKASYTQKRNLPFENPDNRYYSVMKLKAVGTVTKNLHDGHKLLVSWDKSYGEPRDWYFYTGRHTIWPVSPSSDDDFSEKLINFAVHDQPQDYRWFLQQPLWKLKSSSTADDENRTGIVAKYVNDLQTEKNLILRGAPGTGKTYLAKEVAAFIISEGRTIHLNELSDSERDQYSFVQFHPSYDYTDFVEGLRPKKNADGFELKSGSFKSFIDKAVDNWQDSSKSSADLNIELTAREAVRSYIDEIEDYSKELQTVRGSRFTMGKDDNGNIVISVPDNSISNHPIVSVADLIAMVSAHLSAGTIFSKVKDVTTFFAKDNSTQSYSYELTIVNDIIANMKDLVQPTSESKVTQKKFVFVIDEINRGEISKIFGELFYSIDPDYRGDQDGVLTQYSNLHEDSDKKFYVPKNVYIIGTMNDIDRSVDTFDFAMRRRFAFDEITAEESAKNMGLSNPVKEQMERLNSAIITSAGLTTDYQIGASYFKHLKEPEIDVTNAPLWNKKIKPLLQDYLRGENGVDESLRQLQQAYFKEG